MNKSETQAMTNIRKCFAVDLNKIIVHIIYKYIYIENNFVCTCGFCAARFCNCSGNGLKLNAHIAVVMSLVVAITVVPVIIVYAELL